MGRCLIVDDNEEFADNLAEIVRDLGMQAVVANSGPQALGLLRKNSFHLLLSDLKMPGMDGAQLIHEALELQPGLPSVVITAYGSQHSLERVTREGCVAILTKPVQVEHLVPLFETYLVDR